MLGFVGYAMAMVQTGVDPEHLRPRPRAVVHVDHRARGGPRARRRHRRRAGLHRGLRRSARVHRHARRVPGVARAHLPVQAGADAGPARRHVPAARRRIARRARRMEELGPGAPRLRRHRAQHVPRSPPPPSPRPPAASDLGRCRDRHPSHVRRCSASSGGSPIATRRPSPASRPASPTRRDPDRR